VNQLFKYGDNEVRTVMIEGEPWFILNDICAVLELSNPRMVKERLGDDVSSTYPIVDRIGRTQQATIINEDGMYDVILESRKPEAKAFRKWVTSEVLPTIRKTGGYVNNDDLFIDTYLPHADESTRLLFRTTLETVRKQSAIIAEQAPKVEYHDRVLTSEGSLSVTQIAKDFPFAAPTLNDILKYEGVQYKSGGQWVLKAEYQQRGYTDTYTGIVADGGFSYVNTKWTQKGREFIHRLLASKGIHPGAILTEKGRQYLQQVRSGKRPRKKRNMPSSVNVRVTVVGSKRD